VKGMVRIIGGQWRRRCLPVIDLPGLRPSADRVRETLFNWLGQDLSGLACLDVFAGTGVLGFEAASRGAARVLMLEQNNQVAQQLHRNREVLGATQVEVVKADAMTYLAKLPAQSFDVIFLDPPFAQDLLMPALALGCALLRPGGVIYTENAALVIHPLLQSYRQARAGQVYYQLLRTIDN